MLMFLDIIRVRVHSSHAMGGVSQYGHATRYIIYTGLAVGGELAGSRKSMSGVPRGWDAAGGVSVLHCRSRRGRFHGFGFMRSLSPPQPSIPTARVTQVLALAAPMPDAKPAVWLRRAAS